MPFSNRLPDAPFTTKVVGVTFVDGYPDNLYRLAELVRQVWGGDGDKPQGAESLPVVLRRNPLNEYDAHAIEVHMPAMDQVGMIGHISKEMAARLAPELDAGVDWLAELFGVLIHVDHMDRPGISIKLQRVAT